MRDAKFKELFKRHPGNPILTEADWPYSVNSVFNPGATMFQGKTLLLARCEERSGFSHLTKAISSDGVGNWQIDQEPTLLPDFANHPEERWGIEDPRITWLPEVDKWAVVYTAYWAACRPGIDHGFHQLRKARTDYAAARQRCGIFSAPDLWKVGVASPHHRCS